MAIELSTPRADGLGLVVNVLREWQRDGMPVQLHPGDLGWYWRFGAASTAAAVRIWSRDGRIRAVGLLDGPALLRLAIAPDAGEDETVAGRLAADMDQPQRGVLPPGEVAVEARFGAAVQNALLADGWTAGEPWTPLRRELTQPVGECGLRVETVGPEHAEARVGIQRSAFDTLSFTVDRWRAMADGLPYSDGRCLLAYDDTGTPVAAATVWSAGRGRPGLLEPMGVHRDHRGRGYGQAITLAAAAALHQLGSSSAVVCTESANLGGVATYRAAGFRELAPVRDLRRVRPDGAA